MSTENTVTADKKKSKIILFSGIGLCVIVLGFVGVSFLENKVITSTREFFNSMPPELEVKVENIDYSLFSQTLTIDNSSMVDDGVKVSIKQMVLQGFSEKLLTQTTEDYPLVADKIKLLNIELKEEVKKGPEVAIYIDEYLVENWKQNLYLLSQAAKKGYTSEEFWTRLFTFKMNTNKMTNFHVVAKKGKEDLDFNIEAFSLLPAENSSAENLILNTNIDKLTFLYNDNSKTSVELAIGSIKGNNMQITSAELMAGVLQLIEKKASKNLEEKIFDLLSKMTYNKELLAASNLKDFVFKVNDQNMLTIKEISSSTRMKPLLLDYSVNDLIIDKEIINLIPTVRSLLSGIDIEELVVNTSAKIQSDEKLQDLDNTFALDIKDLFATKINFGLGFDKSFSEINFDSKLTPQLNEEIFELIENLELDGLAFSYDDKGFIPLAFYEAMQQGLPLELTLNMIKGELDSTAKDYPLFTSLFTNLAQLLREPGVFNIEITKKNFKIDSLIEAIEKNQDIGFKSSYTSHGKTTQELIEQIEKNQGK